MKNVVVLSTWGAPTATAYLKSLSKVPGIRLLPVFEENEKLEATIARINQERFGDQAPRFLPPGEDVAALKVKKLQSEETLNAIRSLSPDLIILAGSGIVKNSLLDIPKIGTLNCHPGILPRYRGCTCVEWALYEDEPVGATCHFVTEEIDAGDILLKKHLPIFHGESYLQLRLRMFYFCAELIAQAVDRLVNSPEAKPPVIEPFNWDKAQYYKTIPPEFMEKVLEKIDRGSYRHISPNI